MLPAVLVVELGEASFSNPSGLGQGRPLLPSASRDQANMPLFLNLRTMPGRAQPPAEDRESKDGLGATLPGPARLTPGQVPGDSAFPATNRGVEPAQVPLPWP